jgi:hypothetical protein
MNFVFADLIADIMDLIPDKIIGLLTSYINILRMKYVVFVCKLVESPMHEVPVALDVVFLG